MNAITTPPTPSLWRHVVQRGQAAVVAFGPIIAAFLLVGAVFLYGHSPVGSTSNYPAPARYATGQEPSEYSVLSRRNSGWDLFYVDQQDQVAFKAVSTHGKAALMQILAQGADTPSTPAMAANRGLMLGVWVKEHNGALTLEAAYVGPHRSAPFALTRNGLVEHPDVVPRPGGGFDVIFEWQHPGNFDIFLASFPRGASRPVFIRRLARSPSYGFYPRGATDSAGDLDVVYMELCCHARTWLVDFQRFSQAGRPLSRAVTLDRINGLIGAVPGQWGIDLRRAPNGGIWVAWDADEGIRLARFSPAGRLVIPPQLIWSGQIDFTAPAVALALVRGGGVVYYTYPAQLGTLLGSTTFDDQGRPAPSELVVGDSGGSINNPRAGIVRGEPAVIWERETASLQEAIEGSVYHPSQAPIAARFGLSVGNVWISLALLILGVLFTALFLAVANFLTFLVLLLAWIPIGRFAPKSQQWTAYLAIIALILAAIFIVSKPAPAWVFALPAFGPRYGTLAVGGAVFVSFWTGRRLFGHEEPIFRAAAMAFVALYFVAVVSAVLVVQGEMGQM